MRVGIIGATPLALLLMEELIKLEAAPILFVESKFTLPHDLMISVKHNQGTSTYSQWYENELIKLISWIQTHGEIKEYAEVLRMHKKFLAVDECLENGSRFMDLFRIVYRVDPEQGVLKQVAENPEIFQQLGEDVLNSLQEPMEMAEDVDVIIDCRDTLFYPRGLGVDGHAILNEKRWRAAINYGVLRVCSFDQLVGSLVVSLQDVEYVTYVEELLLDKWDALEQIDIIKPRHILLERLVQREAELWQQRVDTFEQKIQEWKSLEDYERIKIPRPAEPVHKLTIWDDYKLMSIDSLLDREEIFLSAEYPEYIEDRAVKTFSAKTFLACHDGQACNTLNELDKGWFDLRCSFVRDGCYDVTQVYQIKDLIIKTLLSYFTKVEV